ncbi:hypothetical protein ABPG72_015312 [Tetrahymena utriculariae]
MNYQRDMNNIQQMLGILLQLPDPNQMLKASKPLDREEGQILVIEQGVVQKYKWQGALPSKLRDEKLQLNFDKQASKIKQNQSLLSYSQQINDQNSISNKRDQIQMRQSNKFQNQSFSVDYRSREPINSYRHNNNLSQSNYDESLGFNQNQSVFIQKNNFFDSSLTPNSTTNRKNQQYQHSLFTPTHNLLSPKNNSFHKNQIRMSISEKMQQPQEQKQVSIKYIGVHNDMIGVLSRKIPMKQHVEKITKCKQIQLERKIKSGAGFRQKVIENQQSCQSDQPQNQELNAQQERNKIFINIKSSKKKRLNAENQNQELKNNLIQDRGTTNDNTLSPMLEVKSRERLLNISQQLYDIKEKEEGEINLSQKELYPDHLNVHQDQKKQHQNVLRQVLEEQDFQSKVISPLIDVRMSQDNKKIENTHSTLSSTQQQLYNHNSIQKSDKNMQLFYTNNSRPNTTAHSRNYYNYIVSPINSQNKQQIFQQQSYRAQSLNQQRRVVQNDPNIEITLENNQINIDKLLDNTQNNFQLKTQEMPDPSKYDKFLVTKYSLERKLTALKKKREENPTYSKKPFYVIWNNQQINFVNNIL